MIATAPTTHNSKEFVSDRATSVRWAQWNNRRVKREGLLTTRIHTRNPKLGLAFLSYQNSFSLPKLILSGSAISGMTENCLRNFMLIPSPIPLFFGHVSTYAFSNAIKRCLYFNWRDLFVQRKWIFRPCFYSVKHN